VTDDWPERVAAALMEIFRASGMGGAGLAGVAVVLFVTVLLLKGRLYRGPPSPDLVEKPPSPPVPVRPDGSIPVANPATPPDPLP